MIIFNIEDKTFGTIMILLTDTKIVFIIKTDKLSVILTDMMILKDGWNGLIEI